MKNLKKTLGIVFTSSILAVSLAVSASAQTLAGGALCMGGGSSRSAALQCANGIRNTYVAGSSKTACGSNLASVLGSQTTASPSGNSSAGCINSFLKQCGIDLNALCNNASNSVKGTNCTPSSKNTANCASNSVKGTNCTPSSKNTANCPSNSVKGTNCTPSNKNTANCASNCKDAANCASNCKDAANCAPSCGKGTNCTSNCKNAANCAPSCGNGTNCAPSCSGTDKTPSQPNGGNQTPPTSGQNGSGSTTTPNTDNKSFEEQVADLVNQQRAANGLKPLTLSTELSDAARVKSQDMHDNRYFAHESPTYGSPFDMLKSFGISYRTAGENIAMGYATPEAVMTAWMNSTGHRANILNASYTHIGVGYVADGNYWTQEFTG